MKGATKEAAIRTALAGDGVTLEKACVCVKGFALSNTRRTRPTRPTARPTRPIACVYRRRLHKGLHVLRVLRVQQHVPYVQRAERG